MTPRSPCARWLATIAPVGPDERVRELLAAGDLRGAATAVMSDVGPQVLRYLRALLRDEDLAAEAFSSFAERLWKGLAGWRGDASLRSWALHVAWNAAANLRDEGWRRFGRRLRSGELSAIAEEVRTRTAVRLERQRLALERLRQALSAEEQTLLILRVDQGLSWAEVAHVVASDGGDPPDANALAKRFERIKARLARMARDQGLVVLAMAAMRGPRTAPPAPSTQPRGEVAL